MSGRASADDSDNDQTHGQRFAAKCVQLDYLARRDADRLLAESQHESCSIGTLAVRRGFLKPETIDIVESLLNPKDIAPGYEILEVVGRGGMGVVYRARQLDLDRIVAIKTILLSSMSSPNVAKRFEREAKAVARLQHPSIVQAWNYGHHNGRYFLVMEFVPGQTCDELIVGGKRLAPVTVWSFVRQTAAGLSHAHQHDVIHRDIKPSNLMVMKPADGSGLPRGVGMIKIADFGLAIMSDTTETQSRLTTENALVGSPAYMSSEQFEGGPIDFRSDIYSLGVTALNLLTSRTPFPGTSIGQLALMKSRGFADDDRSLHGLPKDQRTLLLRMMAPDPEDRPQSYAKLIEQIDALEPVDQPHELIDDTIVGTETVALSRSRFHGRDEQFGKAETKAFTPREQRSRYRQWRIALLISCWLAMGLGAFWLAANQKTARGPRNYKAVSSAMPLFDGVSLAGWDVGGTAIGPWNVAQAPDGSQGIACFAQRGGISRRLPDWEHVRISLFIHVTDEDAIADVDFGLSAGATTSMRSTFRLTANSIAVGRKQDDFGELQMIHQQPSPASITDRYHVVDIERQDSDWYVFFEQKFVFTVPIDPADTSNAVRIVVQENEANDPSIYVADVHASRLSIPKQSSRSDSAPGQ